MTLQLLVDLFVDRQLDVQETQAEREKMRKNQFMSRIKLRVVC